VAVASDDPGARFLFVGGDPVAWGTGETSVLQQLLARIPARLRNRFHFAGPVSREQLHEYFSAARIAVVPSLWENFPNTCIEAMSSGLPVLITPSGGMAEMVSDGETGWVAAATTAGALAGTLRRALCTTPQRLQTMGAAAAAAIRQQCDNEVIGRDHRAVRDQVRRGRGGPAARSAGGHALQTLATEIDVLTRNTKSVTVQAAHTMTPTDVLRAPWTQRVAVLRRAAANPKYVLQWSIWHLDRTFRRASRSLRIGISARWPWT
jgi:hypothetical protein